MKNTDQPSQNNVPTLSLDSVVTSGRVPAYVVGIGASAGGLEALERLFEGMPADTGMAFVVVQHLSPDFKSLTDELLARRTSIPIRQVENGMEIAPDAIYLLPPKKDMILTDGKLLLTDKDPAQFVALPIDRFFRSLAQDAGSRAVAVILSGTGSDGSRGIRDVHMAGGLVIAQAPESAKFDGMPRSATATGTVDYTLPPEEIPAALLQHANHPLAAQQLRNRPEEPPTSGMEAIFRMLRDTYGIDFSAYKPDTVSRRTERRLNGFHMNSVDEYAACLAHDPDELNALYKDLLIGVTRFFRDPEAFERLRHDVLPQLLSQIEKDEEFRVWVAGCATGEEPYSLAMLIQECLDTLGRPIPVKIFATDVHRVSLDHAGCAIYPPESLAGLSEERRDRFFMPRSDGYQVTPELRKMVVFARHNVLKDAPFTKLDLVTCRNLLIYFQPQAQKKTLSLFHFGLKTGGALFLGPSEGPGDLGDEFEALDTRWKIYRKRRDIRLAPDIRLTNPIGPDRLRALGRTTGPASINGDISLTSVLDALLDDSLPPSLLVNDRREVVRTIAGASRYLNLRDGWLSTDILEMVDPELRTALAGALPRAFKELTPVVYKGLRVALPDGERLVSMTVKPVRGRRSSAPYALVRLEELGRPLPLSEFAQEINQREASQEQVLTLESELRSTKENLQAMIEELETSNEELQATNEELVAANEELQSTNEELHSVNEELYTVNAEFQKKIGELTELTADVDNLLTSTEVHTIFLDRDLRIRKFTPKIAETFNLLPQDVGRRIDSFTHTIDHAGLLDDLRSVLANGVSLERQVPDRRGHWYLLRVLPYRTGQLIEGVVITLIDIGRVKKAQAEARLKDQQLTSILRNSPNSIFVKDLQGRFLLVDEKFKRLVGCDPIGKTAYDIYPREIADPWTAQDKQVLEEGCEVEAEIVIPHPDGPHTYLSIMFPMRDEAGQITGLGGIRTDVTQLKRAESRAREAVLQRDRFLAMLSHELRNPLGAILNASYVADTLNTRGANVHEWFAVINRRSRHMARLLDDLLDVSRITQNKIEIRKVTVDLTATVPDAVEEVRPWLDERHLQLTLNRPNEPLLVAGDPSRLQQIQVNLLMNAAKYTPDGGRVWYSLERAGDQGVIRVRDTGVGMSEEMTRRAFDLFVQADQTLDRAGGGIGVGLTLVRSIVELHGGRVEAHSAGPGKGSEFIVWLPLVCGDPATSAAVKPERRTPTGALPRLLIVEDDDDIRESLQTLLEMDGFTIRAVGDATAALAALEEQCPDMALIDIGIPGMNGYELARAIRKQYPPECLRLVALTGYGRPADRQAAYDAGFQAHLTKPVDLNALNEVLLATPVQT